MSISTISKTFNTLGLPKIWQFYVLVHLLLSLSLIFISNEFIFNISNILITNMTLFGVLVGFYKYHILKFSQWGGFILGVAFINLSITLQSLTYFGFESSPTLIAVIEEIGIISLSIFSISFLFQFEKEYHLHGFTINFSLVIASLLGFIFLIAPNLVNQLYELTFTQQLNISNFIFSFLFLSMAIIHQILSKHLLLNDVIRIMMTLLLGSHFGLLVMQDIISTTSGNNLLSRSAWSLYQLTGTLGIIFIFLERLFTDYRRHKATQITNSFMWTASILAIITIPLGIIIRDRLGFSPASALLIGTASFILSSIVIWRLQRLISNINKQRDELKAIAYTDPLTGLYNYHGFLENLSNKKSTESLFVVALNIEDFKSINDLYGREFGDRVLKSLANRLKTTPGNILTARTNSDYFQAVFRTPSSNIPTTIKRIQEHIGIWDIVDNRRIAVPITYGASHNSDLIRPEKLARQAEQALKSSRNEHTNFTLFSEIKEDNPYSRKTLPRHELREILQKAVDDDHLPIHFQPIYDLKDGKLKALELLIRVESEEHGLLLPGQFLEQAQSYGLLTLLTQVCVNMVAKCYDQLPDVTININVPPYMLKNLQVLNRFIACFEKAKLPMNNFCIEVTEDGDIPTDQLIPAIKLLKYQGFKIAMDDFGTGYSSLSRLSVLPVDVVKIDRSLLLAASDGNKSILESAITLTKRLGATTVVEGVETLEQLSLIRQLGADSVQGFLLSRPVNISKASLLSLNATDILPQF